MKKCAVKRVLRGKQTNYEVCDIHSHIIPGVDDGATNLDMAMNLVYMAYLQGATSIVCTSHGMYNLDKYFANMKILQDKIAKEKFGIKLYSGCEIYCNSNNIDHIVECLHNKTIPTMNNTKYILVEFNPYIQISEMMHCISYLHHHGYKTIIAHVERYYALYTSIKWINVLQKLGCLLQVNAYSFVDEKNKQIKKFAKQLLKAKCVTFIGSDAHRTNHRPYAIQNGIDYVYKNCDLNYAEDICYRNAKNMLNIK